MRLKNRLLGALCVWALSTGALAHELQANRATLVLRERQHLSVTFFVNYTAVLHQVLAPKQAFTEFVLMYSSLPPQEFQVRLLGAQQQLQDRTVVVMASGRTIALTHWVWPEATAVQNLVQQRAMQAVVAPGDHAHEVQTEIRAEAKASNDRELGSVTLRLPPELQQVLVVSYQPRQVWVQPGTPSPEIRF